MLIARAGTEQLICGLLTALLQPRIHYACGLNVREGWTNVDGIDATFPGEPTPDLVRQIFRCDLSQPHPFPDDYFELAYSEDFLEHLSQPTGILFFCEVYRCLRPGGVFRLSTPGLVQRIADLDPQHWPEFIQREYTRWHHQCLWSAGDVTAVAHRIGFSEVLPRQYGQGPIPELILDSRPQQAADNIVFELTK